MKKQLLMAAMAVLCFSAPGFAQTKGTSALSFGVNIVSYKNTYDNVEQNETKNNLFTLGYGYFFKDNSKMGLELNYGENKYISTNQYEQTTKTYGGNVSYQKYFPIVKTLFAYAGGKAAYATGTQKQSQTQNNANQEYINNSYSIGAYGGITWFLSKRFAFETSLLSADVAYNSSEQTQNTNPSTLKTKNTSFNLSSQGFINNLGFKIYILF
ncbi:outer membrane beta-barrel protein [Pedobacter jamesrossensis]|uniref:Outer membrane beta-barrel protein n=1 Tax=Pedobacter jamesrossensis TaxID=1908238 RepID=A0ABV8NM51_9SPHI